MRVLLLSDRGGNPGGTERYLAELAEALRAEGDEVRIVAGVPATAPPPPAPGTLSAMAPPDVIVDDPPGPLRAMTQVVNPAGLRALRRELRDHPPDAVHATMLFSHLSPAVLGLLARVPATALATDLRFVCPKGTKLLPGGEQCERPAGRACMEEGCLSSPRLLRDGARQAVYRHGLRKRSVVLACSRHLTSELRALNVPANHLPLPARDPEPGFAREPAPTPTFVYAGRLAPVKGLDDLLRAFAHLMRTVPRARLLICGDGPDREHLAAAVVRLGLGENVRMRPGMALDWTEALRSATALVAPSRFREPLGLSVIEAILHRTPVIASRGGGHAESVEEGVSGLLFDNGDVEGLAAAMARLCSQDPPLDPLVPVAARDRLARRHDPARHLQALRSIWAGAGGSTR